MPRDDDDLRRLTTRLIVLGWLIWSIGLGTDAITKGEVVIWGFTIYELTSFVIIYAFARMHDLEVKRFLPGVEPGRKSGGRNYLEEDSTETREDGGTGGFVFSDESEDDEGNP